MTLRTIALAGAMLAALSGPASAGDGLYLGLEAGWSSPSNIHFHDVNADGHFLLDDGALLGGSMGYKWAHGLRLELEMSYVRYDVNHSDAFNFVAPANGHISQTAYMANAAYDIPISERLRFTLGGGVGAATVMPRVGGDFLVRRDDTVFAWQAITA